MDIPQWGIEAGVFQHWVRDEVGLPRIRAKSKPSSKIILEAWILRGKLMSIPVECRAIHVARVGGDRILGFGHVCKVCFHLDGL